MQGQEGMTMKESAMRTRETVTEEEKEAYSTNLEARLGRAGGSVAL